VTEFDHDYHGTEGPLYTQLDTLDQVDPMLMAFKDSILDVGYPFSADENAPAAVGYMPHVVSIKDGLRFGPYGLYAELGPVENLHIRLNTTVTRIISEGYDFHGQLIVSGVESEYYDGTTTHTIRYMANLAVVLAAGAFQSPQLLMVSGIGDPSVLSPLGIPHLINLPGVGKGLKDHYALPFIYYASQVSPINDPEFFAAQQAQYEEFFTGYLSWPFFDHSALRAASNGEINDEADVAIATTPIGGFVDPNDVYQQLILTLLLNPYSSGTVTISSSSVYDHPIIDYNFFADSRDYEMLSNSFQIIRDIIGNPAFVNYTGPELFPGELPEDIVKQYVFTAEHPMGTCAMGYRHESLAVVDGSGAVIGANGLYIADASIIPTQHGGTPDSSIHGTVILLAKIVANELLSLLD